MPTARLCALRLKEGEFDWKTEVSRTLEKEGCVVREHCHAVDAWRRGESLHVAGGVRLVNGWRATRLWLGPRKWAVAVSPRRIYLTADDQQDSRAESEILRGRSRPQPPRERQLRDLQWALDRLRTSSSGQFGNAPKLEVDASDALDGIHLHAGCGAFAPRTPLPKVHTDGGFFDATGSVRVVVCGDDGVEGSHVDDYRARAKEEFQRRNVEATIGRAGLEGLEQRVRELDGGAKVEHRDRPVLFMLTSKQAPVTERMRGLMGSLENHGIPWRRAYADDPREWSVSDQVGSLYQAAGRLPHRVSLPDGESFPWSIGLDLSHRESASRACAVLMSSNGGLAGAWTAEHERREDFPPDTLRRLLNAATDAIPRGDRKDGAIIIRDGRVFESERDSDYLKGLGGPITLVELRKRKNPPVFVGEDGGVPTQPTVAWFTEVTDGSLAFLVPLPQDRGLGSVLKVWMKDAWDGMKLGPKKVVKVLLAQTLTPGLGLRARALPAPIYWADGIAGASDTDLRFRGIPVERLN